MREEIFFHLKIAKVKKSFSIHFLTTLHERLPKETA